MILKQKIMVGATGLLGMGIGSLGLGVAHAQTPTPPQPAVHAVANTSTPDGAKTSAESDGPGGHQDLNGANVQYGSQSGPDTGGSDTSGN